MTITYIMTETTTDNSVVHAAVVYTTDQSEIESLVGSSEWQTLSQSSVPNYIESIDASRQGFRLEVEEEMDGESEIWVALDEYGGVIGAAIEVTTLVTRLAGELECGAVRSMFAVGGPSTMF